MKRLCGIVTAVIVLGFFGEAKGSGSIPEIIGSVPIGKLAFVTGTNFGSDGTISIIGIDAIRFEGGNPEISSDGTKITYNDGAQLFVHAVSGTSSTHIDNRAQNSDSPSLSPDGSKVAFVVWPKDRESSQIFVSNADGSNWRPLTTGNYYN